MAKVLIVDNEENIRLLFSELLARDGHEVSAANDIKAAFGLLNRQKFDVAVLDIYLDEHETGLQLLAAIREHHREIEVIMVTGNPSTSNLYQALCDGIFVFLVKPVEAQELREAVNRAARQKQIKTRESEPLPKV